MFKWINGIYASLTEAGRFAASKVIDIQNQDQLEEQVEMAIKQLDDIKNRFEHMGKNTNKLNEKVNTANKKIQDILYALKPAKRKASHMENESFFNAFYDDMKKDLETLIKLCDEHLNSNDSKAATE